MGDLEALDLPVELGGRALGRGREIESIGPSHCVPIQTGRSSFTEHGTATIPVQAVEGPPVLRPDGP